MPTCQIHFVNNSYQHLCWFYNHVWLPVILSVFAIWLFQRKENWVKISGNLINTPFFFCLLIFVQNSTYNAQENMVYQATDLLIHSVYYLINVCVNFLPLFIHINNLRILTTFFTSLKKPSRNSIKSDPVSNIITRNTVKI